METGKEGVACRQEEAGLMQMRRRLSGYPHRYPRRPNSVVVFISLFLSVCVSLDLLILSESIPPLAAIPFRPFLYD